MPECLWKFRVKDFGPADGRHRLARQLALPRRQPGERSWRSSMSDLIRHPAATTASRTSSTRASARARGGHPRDGRRLHRHRQARLGHRRRHARTWSGSWRSRAGEARRHRRHLLRGRVGPRASSTSTSAWLTSSGSRTSRSPTASSTSRASEARADRRLRRATSLCSPRSARRTPRSCSRPYQWVEWIKEELDAGAWKVITEGARGRHRRHLPPERRDAHRARRRDRPRGRVSTTSSSRRRRSRPRPGSSSSFGPEREPREHPARRGHPARDAPPRPARRHAEGGAPWRAPSLQTAEPISRPCPRRSVTSLGDERVRRQALPDLLVAEAVVRARAHGLRARPRHRRDRARHAPLLPRELRDARPPRRALRPQADPPRDPDGRRAAPRARARTSGSATPTAAATSARSSRCSRRSSPTTPGSPASAATSRRAAPTRRRWSGPSATASGRSTRSPTGTRSASGPTSPSNEIPYNPLHDAGLPLDRLHSLHPADGARRGGARRPLGRLRQARVRHPSCDDTDKEGRMSEHIYAHEHPESDAAATAASRSGSPASRAPASRRSRTSSGRSSTAAGSSSSTSTATPSARTSRRASASRRRTATRTSSGSAGSPRG